MSLVVRLPLPARPAHREREEEEFRIVLEALRGEENGAERIETGGS